jgi:hypothetical protein
MHIDLLSKMSYHHDLMTNNIGEITDNILKALKDMHGERKDSNC